MSLVRLELDDPATGQSRQLVVATGYQARVVEPVNAVQAGGLA